MISTSIAFSHPWYARSPGVLRGMAKVAPLGSVKGLGLRVQGSGFVIWGL